MKKLLLAMLCMLSIFAITSCNQNEDPTTLEDSRLHYTWTQKITMDQLESLVVYKFSSNPKKTNGGNFEVEVYPDNNKTFKEIGVSGTYATKNGEITLGITDGYYIEQNKNQLKGIEEKKQIKPNAFTEEFVAMCPEIFNTPLPYTFEDKDSVLKLTVDTETFTISKAEQIINSWNVEYGYHTEQNGLTDVHYNFKANHEVELTATLTYEESQPLSLIAYGEWDISDDLLTVGIQDCYEKHDDNTYSAGNSLYYMDDNFFNYQVMYYDGAVSITDSDFILKYILIKDSDTKNFVYPTEEEIMANVWTQGYILGENKVSPARVYLTESYKIENGKKVTYLEVTYLDTGVTGKEKGSWSYNKKTGEINIALTHEYNENMNDYIEKEEAYVYKEIFKYRDGLLLNISPDSEKNFNYSFYNNWPYTD